jgi:hypothetical protein
MNCKFVRLIKDQNRRWINLFLCSFISVLTIVALYWFSNRANHQPNGFIRLFPPHPISAREVLDLRYNSFYIAGITDHWIYLGNHTTPAFLFAFDHKLKDSQKLKLKIPSGLHFTRESTLVMVDSPDVYLTEYKNSLILAGRLDSLNMQVIEDSMAFLESMPVSSRSFVLQMDNETHNQNLLARKNYNLQNLPYISSLLDKKHEGIIMADGKLLFEKNSGRLFYIYYYHNQFLSIDTNLNLVYSAKTIDTISSPQIKLSMINGGTDVTMAAPPLMVNKKSSLNSKWLFINSGLRANNEIKESFDSSSVMDIYELTNGRYQFSFHVVDYNNEKLKSFQVYNQEMIVLYEHYIFIYQLKF